MPNCWYYDCSIGELGPQDADKRPEDSVYHQVFVKGPLIPLFDIRRPTQLERPTIDIYCGVVYNRRAM
jgi:hypothetical protein